MGALELFLLAISLAMDAFAVSICGGLSLQKKTAVKVVFFLVYGLEFFRLLCLL